MLQIKTLKEEFYKPSRGLLAAINTSLFLNRPLLLSGEPGTGKTECADFVARQLCYAYPDLFKADSALRFNTKSVSQSTDLFYQYDAVAHFGDKEDQPKESFISFASLGTALLRTNDLNKDWYAFENYETEVVKNGLGTGSVVLIDEIDKAPRDFPNDLLAELEKPPFKFNIKELNGLEIIQNTEKPIVIIITSNNEKGLPDAFLRRCIFHHINFPEPDVLLQIVQSKLGDQNPFFKDAISLFTELREKREVAKPPSTSELIDWISCLMDKELVNEGLKNWKSASPEFHKKIEETLGVIAKNRTDFESLKKAIEGK